MYLILTEIRYRFGADGNNTMDQLYDHIGLDYDVTRKADPEITRRIYNHLQLFNNEKVLDVACGSGNYTIALNGLGLQMSGIDISAEMIRQANMKFDQMNWFISDVRSMPFGSGLFSGVTCILAIHHFQDLIMSFREVNRVLHEKSRFVIFTSTPEQMRKYWLNEYFPKMMEKSCVQMPNVENVTNALKESGFNVLGYETFLIQPNLKDFFLYSGKYHPEIYFRPEVRSGISSFAALAEDGEREAGLNRLGLDIKSGVFKKIFQKYLSDLGDYLFVVAEKSDSIG